MHSNEIGHGNDEEPQPEATQVDTKDKHEVNIEQVIKNIQVDELIENVVPTTQVSKPMVLTIEVFQLIQHVVELVSLENPQFPTMQSTPISRYST